MQKPSSCGFGLWLRVRHAPALLGDPNEHPSLNPLGRLNLHAGDHGLDQDPRAIRWSLHHDPFKLIIARILKFGEYSDTVAGHERSVVVGGNGGVSMEFRRFHVQNLPDWQNRSRSDSRAIIGKPAQMWIILTLNPSPGTTSRELLHFQLLR